MNTRALDRTRKFDLDGFAHRILFGGTLADKLAPLVEAAPVVAAPQPFEVPAFPCRPPELCRIGAAEFPSIRQLHDPVARGHILHFFANHELLAMELMALVLLKFPDAPADFRSGLAHTIQEEQSHLRLYLDRMQVLGVQFGDLPLSDYFWSILRQVKSPLEFVTQMSLTFEQANLDYSAYYRDVVADAGDAETAAILDRVYREEIGHVKHGVVWFNRWRDQAESDWDAYKRLLPPPLTPRRAKGMLFDAAARRQAGLSEAFIRGLELHAGSKGRAPVVWFFNPSCDAEIVRNAPGYQPQRAVQDLADDLAPLLMFLSHDPDIIHVRRRPRAEWLKHLADSGFRVPEFVEDLDIREPKLSGFEPWGWSPEVLERFRPLADRLVVRKDERSMWHRALLRHADFASTKLGDLFAKTWAADFLRAWLEAHPETQAVFGSPQSVGITAASAAQVEACIAALTATGQRAVVKAPWGTAGNQIQRIAGPRDLTAPVQGWIRNQLASQGRLLVEPWLDKQRDLSMQMEVRANGEAKLLGAREFLTDERWHYRGAVLGRASWRLTPEENRFWNEVLPAWLDVGRDVGRALARAGYQGPAGIDAILHRTPSGALQLKPLGELNPRWTLGRVALELEKHVAPGARAVWSVVRKDSVDVASVQQQHPAQFVDAANGHRIERGIFFTTDPQAAKRVLTALVVGPAALRDWQSALIESPRTSP